MKKGKKELLVVGDRVLIEPDEGEVRTREGLVLPAGAVEKEPVQGGRVMAIGPGTPLPPPQDDAEPWKAHEQQAVRYIPMQVQVGDYAVFFRKAATEVTFEDQKFLVVPQAAVLIVVRESSVPDTLPDDL
jgi:co-chaperonin GroES (HSP10)